MKTAILKYNAGNICSVVHALNRLGVTPVITDNPDELRQADRIIIPGQGHAVETLRYLQARGLDRVIRSLTQPVLGICIGQQLLCEHTEEGDLPCLGIYTGAEVKKFRFPSLSVKIPHVGWNTIRDLSSPLFDGLSAETYVYYVHSYYVPVDCHTIAVTEYGGHLFSAAMQKNNFLSTQFHPEKSGRAGETILHNFLNNHYD